MNHCRRFELGSQREWVTWGELHDQRCLSAVNGTAVLSKVGGVHTRSLPSVRKSRVMLKVSLRISSTALSARNRSILAAHTSFHCLSMSSSGSWRMSGSKSVLTVLSQCVNVVGGPVRIVLPEKRLFTLFSKSWTVSTRLVTPKTAKPFLPCPA